MKWKNKLELADAGLQIMNSTDGATNGNKWLVVSYKTI
jgi:hypothetical protein